MIEEHMKSYNNHLAPWGFVSSGTPYDKAKVKRTKAYQLLKYVVFDDEK